MILLVALIQACGRTQTTPSNRAAVLSDQPALPGEDADLLAPEGSFNGATHNVVIKNFRLDPQEITIRKGDRVIWQNDDMWREEGIYHQFFAHNNRFRTPKFFSGESANLTFEEPGTYTYFDVIYKEREFLRGKITVLGG
ncbi:hypothetical protein HYU14_00540 [Candidatus Woesearchaeota archaeon]|nr:hypothetical protein [Candidatus Woesearchaeota archaeon]